MAFTFGFYNSLNGDRRYDAIQMSSIFDGIIKDGVFMSIGSAMMVVAGTGMQVNIGLGRAWFDHTWTLNDSLYPVTLSQSEVLQDRIDTIVLEIDSDVSVRANQFKVIKGTPSSTPAAPIMANTTTLHQYPLCDIRVNRGATSITQANITNRVGTSVTPFITGILETMNIDALIVKWERQWTEWSDAKKTEFINWFLSLRDILDDDAITALTLRVLDLEEGFEELKKSVSDGKSTIAAAITLQGVITAATATFAQMATNIKAIIRGSGTALASHVLSPYTFTNSTGVQLTGTIPSKAAATITPGTSAQTLAAGQYLSGAHTIANLGGTATAGQVLATATFSSNNAGRAVQGTIPSRGAATINPSTSQQVIPAGQFLSGAQTIPGASTLVAANIKKGVSIFGVTGTWEGFVPTTTDIFNNGTWQFNPIFGTNWGSSIISESGMIRIASTQNAPTLSYLKTAGFAIDRFNLSGFTRLSIELDSSSGTLWNDYILLMHHGTTKNLDPATGGVTTNTLITSVTRDTPTAGRRVLWGSFSGIQLNNYLFFTLGSMNPGVRIYRIWLS